MLGPTMGAMLATHLLHKVDFQYRQHVKDYAQEVIALSAKIDPNSEQDWKSLWMGFALARKLGLAAASSGFYMKCVFPCERMSIEDLLGPLPDDYVAYLETELDVRD